MLFTKKHLIQIEEAVGHSCEAGVLAGRDQGGVAIRVWAKQPSGEMFNCQEEFTAADFVDDRWEPKFDHFKHWAKKQFDDAKVAKMSDIDISKMNKAEVLAKLFNSSKAQGLGFLQSHTEPMTTKEAQELLDDGQTYFDYLRGRVMKVDLAGDTLRTGLYDRDNGPGAAATALGV